MVTIAILVILLAVTVPSMRTFVASQRVKTSSFDVYAAMMFARSEAIKRRGDVSIVASTTNWTTGYSVVCPVPTCAAQQTLRSQDALSGVSVTASSATLTYRLDGRLSTGDALLQVESQTDSNGAGRRCVTVDTTGLPRSKALTGAAVCT